MTIIIPIPICMAGICLLVLIIFVLAWNVGPPKWSDTSTEDEIRRIGDASIDTMQQTSRDFKEHIDRQTRR